MTINLNDYDDKNNLKKAILDIAFMGGNTNTAAGIKMMRTQSFSAKNGDRPDAQNIAIVLTDGVSTRNRTLTIPYAEMSHADGIRMIVVGVTNDTDVNEISGIASPPRIEDRDYYLAADFHSLKRLAVDITNTACNDAKGG